MVLLPLVILMFVIGILPNLVLDTTVTTVSDLLHQAGERRAVLVDASVSYTWLDPVLSASDRAAVSPEGHPAASLTAGAGDRWLDRWR
jgi:hypothetical protein